MDTGQLQMILTTLNGAGESAYWFGVSWLVVEFLKALMVAGCVGGAIYTVYRLARAIMSNVLFTGRIERTLGDFFSEAPTKQERFCEWLAKQQRPPHGF